MSESEATAREPAEYPKCLYKGGIAYDVETGRHVPHQYMRTVEGPEEEAEARADGYAAAGEDQPIVSEVDFAATNASEAAGDAPQAPEEDVEPEGTIDAGLTPPADNASV